jgi:hypothetical protein
MQLPGNISNWEYMQLPGGIEHEQEAMDEPAEELEERNSNSDVTMERGVESTGNGDENDQQQIYYLCMGQLEGHRRRSGGLDNSKSQADQKRAIPIN